MLRLASYDIVFQEVPGEVTLALNLSGCSNGCHGCHSPHLREDTGEPLDEDLFHSLIRQYGSTVTCICFMGGDGEPHEVERLAKAAKALSEGRLKAAWYSGRDRLPAGFDGACLDYLKLGPFIESLGGLRSATTNQRFYRRITAGEDPTLLPQGAASATEWPDGFTDITAAFR
ncbi:MAG: anaerobic ribonucleoside-triphosphate reductase activating protein [Rikenellaceae bacterium]|nr:anaerobic ribonucleoside-triphosphate reductase activating protein [Rikenellaceae bacterium]